MADTLGSVGGGGAEGMPGALVRAGGAVKQHAHLEVCSAVPYKVQPTSTLRSSSPRAGLSPRGSAREDQRRHSRRLRPKQAGLETDQVARGGAHPPSVGTASSGGCAVCRRGNYLGQGDPMGTLRNQAEHRLHVNRSPRLSQSLSVVDKAKTVSSNRRSVAAWGSGRWGLIGKGTRGVDDECSGS